MFYLSVAHRLNLSIKVYHVSDVYSSEGDKKVRLPLKNMIFKQPNHIAPSLISIYNNVHFQNPFC